MILRVMDLENSELMTTEIKKLNMNKDLIFGGSGFGNSLE